MTDADNDHPAAAEYRAAVEAARNLTHALRAWHSAAYIVHRHGGGDERFTAAGNRDALDILVAARELAEMLHTHPARYGQAAGAPAACVASSHGIPRHTPPRPPAKLRRTPAVRPPADSED